MSGEERKQLESIFLYKYAVVEEGEQTSLFVARASKHFRIARSTPSIYEDTIFFLVPTLTCAKHSFPLPVMR